MRTLVLVKAVGRQQVGQGQSPTPWQASCHQSLSGLPAAPGPSLAHQQVDISSQDFWAPAEALEPTSSNQWAITHLRIHSHSPAGWHQAQEPPGSLRDRVNISTNVVCYWVCQINKQKSAFRLFHCGLWKNQNFVANI